MDTSDEYQLNETPFLGQEVAQTVPTQSTVNAEPTAPERASQIIEDAEKAKAVMSGIKGKLPDSNIALMDQDYQMIDSHVEESLRRKILNFEYVDLSKLLNHNKPRDEECKMEFISKNSMTFLSPVTDRDNLAISSYGCWEQAFSLLEYFNVQVPLQSNWTTPV